jgi:hypothetical protein
MSLKVTNQPAVQQLSTKQGHSSAMCYVHVNSESQTLLPSSQADTKHISSLHCRTVYITIYLYFRLGWCGGGRQHRQNQVWSIQQHVSTYNHACGAQNGERCIWYTKWRIVGVVHKMENCVCGTQNGESFVCGTQNGELYMWYTKWRTVYVVPKMENRVCGTQNGESCMQHTKWNPHSLQIAKITCSLITKSDSRFKFTLEQNIKAQCRSGGIALLFL